MADYIACRPCRFGGVNYKKGERVPGEKVLPQKANELIAMKYIKKAPVEQEKSEAIEATEATAEPEKAQTKRRTSKK